VLPERFKHQKEVQARSRDLEAFALFWEQGTGKTRLTLDTLDHLASPRKINAALIVAPNGVHQMWIEDEIPKWLAGRRFFTGVYNSNRASTKAHEWMLEQAIAAAFPVMAMSYDAFMTARGKAWVKTFLKKRSVLYVCDESTAIKTPKALRTKAIVGSGVLAPYRRILTGTPINNSPFDIYTQIRFLDPLFWKKAGFLTYSEFKAYFGIWEKGYNKAQEREFSYVVGYRNLDELQRILEPISSRVLKVDVLDLPPKLYSKRYFELSPEQRRVYTELKEQALTVLATGDLVTVPLVITRLLRLHQVTSNYLPREDDEPAVLLGEPNPRLQCLSETLEEISGQAIIWARFNHDVDQITALLGKDVVRADGRDSSAVRQERINQFKAGKVRFLVSKPQTKGVSRGQTMVCAQTVIYYNNTFSYEDRVQSEDRTHRAGQHGTVNYIDIVASGTVDVHIVESLRRKYDIASQITGDQLREWI
jgi:SNF2 family DNA or RNA helicase